MKKYTLEDFNNFDKKNDCIQCPSGDYTQIKEFPSNCSFGKGCYFGGCCYFGKGCYFSKGCYFGGCCSFGEHCSFGEDCYFGKGCKYNGHEFLNMMSVGYIGSKDRATYAFRTKDDVRIQCGCNGDISLKEFEEQVLETHANNDQYREEYLAAINLIKIWSKRELDA